MKSTWFGDSKRYEFAKCLKAADYSLQTWDVVDCFLKASFGAHCQGLRALAMKELCPEIEKGVIEAQERVKHPIRLSECYAMLVMALEEEAYDFLGSVLSELEQVDKSGKGQCFTPPALCEVMAEMTLKDARPGDRLRLHEPSVGGGATVIAASEVLKARGFFPWHYYVDAVDVDWRMYAISFLQFSLLGIPATVRWGNTLTLESWGSVRTFAAVMHP